MTVGDVRPGDVLTALVPTVRPQPPFVVRTVSRRGDRVTLRGEQPAGSPLRRYILHTTAPVTREGM